MIDRVITKEEAAQKAKAMGRSGEFSKRDASGSNRKGDGNRYVEKKEVAKPVVKPKGRGGMFGGSDPMPANEKVQLKKDE